MLTATQEILRLSVYQGRFIRNRSRTKNIAGFPNVYHCCLCSISYKATKVKDKEFIRIKLKVAKLL